MLSVKQNPNKTKKTPGLKQECNLTESITALACDHALAFPSFSPEQSRCILTEQQRPVMHKWAIPKCPTVCFAMENGYAVIFRLVVLVLRLLIRQTVVTFVFIACSPEI